MPTLIGRVRQVIAGPHLWTLDRQFCVLTQPRMLAQDGDHFLIRGHPGNQFERDSSRTVVASQDATCRDLLDQWDWLGSPRVRHRLLVRRSGDEEVILVTDLLDETMYAAADLLTAYLHHWGIERVFQQVAEVFSLQQLIGSMPQATICRGAF